MNRNLARALFLIPFALVACITPAESDESGESEVGTVTQALHPSGVCRIDSDLHWTSKVVHFYRINNPNQIWQSYSCDPWVGTSECCAKKESIGLSVAECQQLRHDPDCPPEGGEGGPYDDGEGPIGP